MTIFQHGLMRLGQACPRYDLWFGNFEQPCCDHVVHPRDFKRVAQMRAQYRRGRHQDLALARPDLRRVEGKSPPCHVLGKNDAAGEGFNERSRNAERVLPRAFDDQVGRTAGIIRGAQNLADRRTERLHYPVLIIAHCSLEDFDIRFGIGQPRHRVGPQEIGPLAPPDCFEADDPLDCIL